MKAYFDFIIAIGNTRFSKENGSLREILKASVDQKLKMIVFNTRSKQVREVEIVPSTSWGGNGLLGVSIKHQSFDRADERVWHVLEVENGSPAQQAGFIPNEDYIIGSDSILQESDDLYNLIEAHEGKALKLFVYNISSDNCRDVICHPNSKWGGKGYLGCEFGHGLLHRIPQDGAFGINESSKPPLLRNDHLLQQQIHQLNTPSQPGQELFQQALSDPRSLSQQQYQHQQQQQQPNLQQQLPPPPQQQPPQLYQQQQQQQLYQQQYQQQLLSSSSSSSEQAAPMPVAAAVAAPQRMPVPQLPQTFAQLANAQMYKPTNEEIP